MAFSESFLDEIRTRVPIASIVGKKVKLTRRGKEYLGLCPFHHEKTPSFTVNEDKGFYHCFGCQAHGSLFDFVMKTEGMEFRDAVERLAAEAGLPMPARDEREVQSRDEREALVQACEAAAGWFQSQLQSRAGAEARKYLESRKLGADALARFRIGFAPESRTALKDTLVGRGIAEKVLIESGLVIKPDDSSETYDRFRNRVIFPIADGRGRIVAFGGRTLGDAKPKYLNSPETALFHKGALLYNLGPARAAARESASIILCEGYTDVIALAQAGFADAVAPLGTAVTELQLRELWRMAPEPIVCLDGDAAGWQAALRVARKALPHLAPGHSLRFAILPAGEDPDSLLRRGGLPELKTALEGAIPLAEVLWRSTATGDFSTPERRAGLRDALQGLVREVAHPVVREYYKRHFSAQLQAAFPVPERRAALGSKARRGPPDGTWQPRLAPKLVPAKGLGQGDQGSPRRRERVLLATLVNRPELLHLVEEPLAALAITDSELDGLRRELLNIAPIAESLDSAALRAQLTDTARPVADRLAAESMSMVEKFVRPGMDLADAQAHWRDVWEQHARATADLEHRWF